MLPRGRKVPGVSPVSSASSRRPLARGSSPRLQLPGGQLQGHLAQGVTELADQRHPALPVHGKHRHPAGVLHHLPVGDPAIQQPGLVPADIDDDPLVHGLLGDHFFLQFHWLVPRFLWNVRRPVPPGRRRPAGESKSHDAKNYSIFPSRCQLLFPLATFTFAPGPQGAL